MARNAALDVLEQAMREYELGSWRALPDLELYMDQVITYLKRQLILFQDATDNSLITPSMINNYVKDGIVPRPINKKYAQPQLAALTIACILKRALPMQRIKQLIAPGGAAMDEAQYEAFGKRLKDVLLEEAERLSAIDDRATLSQLATDFAMRASIDCLIADHLLAMINEGAPVDKKPEREHKGR